MTKMPYDEFSEELEKELTDRGFIKERLGTENNAFLGIVENIYVLSKIVNRDSIIEFIDSFMKSKNEKLYKIKWDKYTMSIKVKSDTLFTCNFFKGQDLVLYEDE